MKDANGPDLIDFEKISPERRTAGIRGFFFGSLPRSMATIIAAFFCAAVIHALFAGSDSAKKAADRKNQNQSREDLAEANRLLSEKGKSDQERILSLTKENQELKDHGLKEEIKLQPPQSMQKPELPDLRKQAPVFSGPGDAVHLMALQEQKKSDIQAYQPMQRVSPPPDPASAQAHQLQTHTPINSQENKEVHEKNLLGGSRAFGSLSHGVAAVSGLPYPVVIDLISASTGPNSTSRPIRDCAIIAVASADLSAARVYMQAKTLNCYIGGRYIEQAVDGYIVDLSDGLIGLKGKVDERSGPYIAELILSSFAAGVSRGFAAGEMTTTVSSEGVVNTSITGSAMRAGLFSGASSAAEKLSKKLEEKADKFLPFVEVKPTDKVQLVFSSAVYIPDDYHGVNMREITWVK